MEITAADAAAAAVTLREESRTPQVGDPPNLFRLRDAHCTTLQLVVGDALKLDAAMAREKGYTAIYTFAGANHHEVARHVLRLGCAIRAVVVMPTRMIRLAGFNGPVATCKTGKRSRTGGGSGFTLAGVAPSLLWPQLGIGTRVSVRYDASVDEPKRRTDRLPGTIMFVDGDGGSTVKYDGITSGTESNVLSWFIKALPRRF